MSKYSELVGSFLRNAPFPLEADYVFESEEALRLFYEEPENKAIVYQGWFKIVGEGKNQSLYWVVKEEDELKFVKLLQNIDRDTIYEDLSELSLKLTLEILDRQDADSEIWGNKDEVISNLLNIEALSKAVDTLMTQMEDMTSAVSTIIKGDNTLELEEFEDYLKELDYPSIEALSTVVSKFLNDFDDSTDTIDTWPELLEFLKGYTDKDRLKDVLQNLCNDILGNVEPGTTLESLRRHLLDLIQALNNRCYNLQTELDQTQVGVGLSGDGSYNPDKETYYLKDATSVMNALKTLDRLLHKHAHIDFQDTDTIDFDVQEIEEHPSRIVKASVKIAANSDIEVSEEGLYHKVDITHNNGLITLFVNDEERTSFNIGIDPLLESAYYDKATENIVLIFKLHNGEVLRIEISAEDLITEWTTENTKTITLKKTRVVDGLDVLTATVNISKDSKNGIIEKEDGIFASKDASDLTYKGATVEEAIDSLKQADETLSSRVDTLESDVSTVKQDVSELQTTTSDLSLRTESLEGRVDSLEENDGKLDSKLSELDESITAAVDKIDTLKGDVEAILTDIYRILKTD